MRKSLFLSLLLVCTMLLGLTACGGGRGIDNNPEPEIKRGEETSQSSQIESNAQNDSSVSESTETSENPASKTAENQSSLVVYFSWSGHLQSMARWVADETGSDLYRVTPKEAYSTDYNTCADRAKNEVDNGILPELDNLLDEETVAQYDIIYVGFPVWWYELPMSMKAFLSSYDLSGKTIIPFFSHEGSSNGAGSLGTLKDVCEGAAVITDDVLSVRGGDVDSSEEEVREWARSIVNENK